MNKHAIGLLEFEAVRRELIGLAWSAEGRAALAAQDFFLEREALLACRRAAADFRTFLMSLERAPSFDFPDIVEVLERLAKQGLVLEIGELFALMRYLRAARELGKLLAGGDGLVADLGLAMPDLSELQRRLAACIAEDGQLRENDIPSLRSIRSSIRALSRDIEQRARAYMSSGERQGIWQSDLATHKDGRLVLPMNANFRGRLDGVVYETSATGATVYFEPLDIFERNNQLVQEENRYRQELFRILKELSALAHGRLDELLSLSGLVGEIDDSQLRARHSILHGCFCAEIGDEFSLRAARHPFLGATAVAIDLQLGLDKRILLISGPNTGGKTVALKTAGLLVMMNQFGLDIPAELGSRLPLFEDVFADIGDEQSIAASLSTFSAHLINLTFIAGSAHERCLVLLDELGSGTDPEQGAALGMAFLDLLAEKRAFCLASTHLGALKRYALGTDGVANAAVDFDVEELKPLYRIRPGIHGSSHAFEIARRLGVPADIIERARDYARREQSDAARIMSALAQREEELKCATETAQAARLEAETRGAQLELERRRVAEKELELRQEGIRELGRFLAQTRRTLEGLVRQLRESVSLPEGRTREIKDFMKEGEEFLEVLKSQAESETARMSPPAAGGLHEGTEVFVGPTRRRGTLKRRGKNRSWLVDVGAISLSVEESELSLAPPAAGPGPPGVLVSLSEEREAPALSLDIRGFRAEEAMRALERQLDRAVLQGLYKFSIIHGRGEGILQSMVRDHLKSCSFVENFEIRGPPGRRLRQDPGSSQAELSRAS